MNMILKRKRFVCLAGEIYMLPIVKAEMRQQF